MINIGGDTTWGGICVGWKVTLGADVTVGKLLTFEACGWYPVPEISDDISGVMAGPRDEVDPDRESELLDPAGGTEVLFGIMVHFLDPEDTPSLIHNENICEMLGKLTVFPESIRGSLKKYFGNSFKVSEKPGIFLFSGGELSRAMLIFGDLMEREDAESAQYKFHSVYGRSEELDTGVDGTVQENVEHNIIAELDLSVERYNRLSAQHGACKNPAWYFIVSL